MGISSISSSNINVEINNLSQYFSAQESDATEAQKKLDQEIVQEMNS